MRRTLRERGRHLQLGRVREQIDAFQGLVEDESTLDLPTVLETALETAEQLDAYMADARRGAISDAA